MDIRQLFQEARQDVSLQNTLCVDDILSASVGEKEDAMISAKDMEREIYEVLRDLPGICTREIYEYCLKLRGYRLIDEIFRLDKGKHTRWIRIDRAPYVLTQGGPLTDVKFTDRGALVQFKLYGGRFLQHPFDQCLFFQKLTMEEEIALHCYP
jgi:hypothetical protein